MVPDVYHILYKGKGVFTNVSSEKAKAKLRLLYEAGPIALLVESAGGLSSVEPNYTKVKTSVLDVKIEDLDQRIGICYGSEVEVKRFDDILFG